MVIAQQLDRMAEAHPLGFHHPVDHRATFTASTQAVPQVRRRAHHEAGGFIIVERAVADIVLAVSLQNNPAALHSRCRLTSDFN